MPELKWYQFHLSPRLNHFSPILNGGRLFQRFLVDVYATIEAHVLAFVRAHQGEIRSDAYSSIDSYLNRDDSAFVANEVGQRIILPSSFLGGDRAMQQLFQDSMAIVRHFGKPSLFLTFTANPNWIECQRELQPQEDIINRPDILCRVFNMKRDAFLKDIDRCYGHWVGNVWTLEYQKRGYFISRSYSF